MTLLRALILAAVLAVAALPAAAHASATNESTFQDDPVLVYGSPERQDATMKRLAQMGVDRIRVSVFWKLVAPLSSGRDRPNFDASDPGAYPQENWARYDNLVRLGQQYGIAMNFNITTPVPHWAAAPAPEDRPDIQETHGPDAVEFGRFVTAVGTRYSGTYNGLPRVDYWSIGNEPNQAGWLTPQWSPDPRNASHMVESAPHVYRALLQQAWAALDATGHGGDTILIGETAPSGQQKRKGLTQSIDPLRFIRQLYCLDANLQFLQGSSAEVRGCPVENPSQAMKEQHPALFNATGYAHHPYALLTPPASESNVDDWVTMADLGDLSSELRRIYQRFGVAPQTPRGTPLYLTEYGYQTKPDPLGLSFARQAAYINEAEYIAFRNPLVRTHSQFLLVDDGPVAGIDPKRNPRDAYRTFQSGLRSLGGKNKPAYDAYVTPIHVVTPSIRRGRRARVFTMIRPAKESTRKRVRIQWRPRGAKRWRTIATRTARGPRHYLVANVRVRRTGALRVRWHDGKRPRVSRAAPIRVR